MTDPARLYEEDWYAWTQDQAALLRRWPAELRPNALDLEHIAEEIEDLGKELRRQVEGLMRRLIEHLLKLEFSPDEDPRRHGMKEVAAFRADIRARFGPDDSPSLYARRADLYARPWNAALRLYRKDLEVDGQPIPPVLRGADDAPRYDFDM
ncbi:DUF29 domain-containing protein [Roseomonas sp. CCTCC AB2023176]|uniref:DUF29 domain-containing protein n=1 Tax=Roseomonas sp. CCTCC AB2023176 TaxID=3342640 RepID=UPI0035DF9DB4